MKPGEKRKLERFKLQLLSHITVRGKGKDIKTIKLLTQDVSSGGAFFKTPDPLSVGTRVDLDLVIKIDRLKNIAGNSALVNLTGTIIRTHEEGMAICFDENFQISPLDNNQNA
ncbi:MAG TPA: PilZ domain-containing protein [Desulfobacterales bacterium]|nr:PilZ domain-containing protein [Desulfobacterales bacterium]